MTNHNPTAQQTPNSRGPSPSSKRIKLLRITTVPISLQLLLKGQFSHMIDHGYDVIAISADGSGVDDVRAEGAQHIAIPFTRQITPLQDLQCLIALVKVIRQIRPDIIHTHTPKAGLLGMLAGKICNVPIRMHTVAGLPLMEARGLKRKVLEFTERLTYAAAHRVYPNSKGLESFIHDDLKVDRAKIHIIGKGSSNGIDTEYFSTTSALQKEAHEIRTKYSIKPDDIAFCFIGRIVKDKGIIELVSAFRKLSAEAKTAGDLKRYFLIAVGPFEEALDPLPADVMTFLKENPNVILPGFQKDVRPWLLASDIFVFPSYREGFPNVVMQASLLQVACIVSDINGCNEIIEDNVRGLIVPVKNVDALFKAMLKLSNDGGLRKSLSIEARKFVSMHYDRRYVWEEIRREYASLLDARTIN